MEKLRHNFSAVWAASPFPSLLADWRHWLPFVGWLGLLLAMQAVCGKSAWGYAAMTVAGVVLLAVAKPWRLYGKPERRKPETAGAGVAASSIQYSSFVVFPVSLAAGLAVFAFWVGPETEWMRLHFPAFHRFYAHWCGFPFGTLENPAAASPYAPEACGWTLALVRVAGSAFVIAVIEEFFWRGWLYRRLIARDVRTVPLRLWDWEAFAIMVVLFGVEHDRWLAGMAAGAVYGWLMLRTGRLWPAITAHAVTNLVLGLYVLGTGRYGFW
jgi:CAAX prenyl protease-like protein